MIATICQECGSPVDVPEEYLRQPVKCGGCQKVFVALPSAEAHEKFNAANPESKPQKEPEYYFRLEEKILCSGTIPQLAASKFLLQTDAVIMNALPREGGAAIPLYKLIDFSKPWRTTLPEGEKPVSLPPKQAGLLGTVTPDPLTPHWGREYFVRVAGGQAQYFGKTLRSIMENPPFPREDFWKVELKDSYHTEPYVPLTSMLDFSNGWPTPPGIHINPQDHKSFRPTPVSKLVPIGDVPGTEGLSIFAGLIGVVGTLAGIVLLVFGFQIESVSLGIAGCGVIAGSILQAGAITLFCRLCRDVYAIRRENQEIMNGLKKLTPSELIPDTSP